uniref:CAAX prenyl protease 2 n=1 Tax=Phallusia mammillata TaxID=59560 RepID=A0A6F9DPX9_9ASCI|nr:CAAX prenyl protease 2-like [Phallusia mammillata]
MKKNKTMFSDVCFDEITKIKSVLLCFLFATLYVGSLYVKSQRLPRDHPKTIKERFMRVALSSTAACAIVYLFSSNPLPKSQVGSLFEWIGIRKDGFVIAILCPTILIAILFLGPLVMFLIDHGIKSLRCYSITDIMIWRNYIVAPLSEELVFRGCMMPILVPAFGQFTSILLAPWFFGLAHLHHAAEMYMSGFHTLSSIVLSTLFQAFYTTVFGILSSFIFLRTGHLTSAVVSHAFCNIMGFPDFENALQHKQNILICCCFVAGLVLFIALLFPLTEPELFQNRLYTR